MKQSDLHTSHARALRKNMTDAERILWFALRDRRFRGLEFRRQVPVGPYIVDFLCRECRLIVEADGGQHADSVNDRRRDAYLIAQGFTVIRLWNHDILTNLTGCLEHLAETSP